MEMISYCRNRRNENDKIAALAFRGLSWGLVAKGMVDEAIDMEQKARTMLLEIFGGNKKHNQFAAALRYFIEVHTRLALLKYFCKLYPLNLNFVYSTPKRSLGLELTLREQKDVLMKR